MSISINAAVQAQQPSSSRPQTANKPSGTKHHSHHQFIIGGPLNRRKYTTRHLAALQFLQNIPLANEASIRKHGVKNALRGTRHPNDERAGNSDDDENDIQEVNLDGVANGADDGNNNVDSAGKKLRGPAVASLRYPGTFRYKLQTLPIESAMVRQWEEKILGSSSTSGYKTRGNFMLQEATPILSTRIFFSRANSYPLMVSSFIKYDAGEEKAKIMKLRAEDHKGLEKFNVEMRDWRGLSYKGLFKPIMVAPESRREREGPSSDFFYLDQGFMYDPSAIDDPDMLHGSHRYVLQRSTSTVPIICSIILFVNKQELKQSLNEQFRELHPSLPPSITLSRIRNVKKTSLLQCMAMGIEIATVALAVINFERLCLKNIVTKANRKLSMAVSLILAYKFNENNSFSSEYSKKLKMLLDFFDREWHLPKRQVLDAEFGAYVHLELSLHVPYQHIQLVFSRLLKLVHTTPKNYLGDGMFDVYASDIVRLDRHSAPPQRHDYD